MENKTKITASFEAKLEKTFKSVSVCDDLVSVEDSLGRQAVGYLLYNKELGGYAGDSNQPGFAFDPTGCPFFAKKRDAENYLRKELIEICNMQD